MSALFGSSVVPPTFGVLGRISAVCVQRMRIFTASHYTSAV